MDNGLLFEFTGKFRQDMVGKKESSEKVLKRIHLLSKSTNYKHVNTIPVLVSHTQAEMASGVCPTNLRVSAGSIRMKSNK
jgi:hypothetical protein